MGIIALNSITNVFIGYLLLGDTAPTFNGIKQSLFIVVCEWVGNSSRARQGQHHFDPCGIGVGGLSGPGGCKVLSLISLPPHWGYWKY